MSRICNTSVCLQIYSNLCSCLARKSVSSLCLVSKQLNKVASAFLIGSVKVRLRYPNFNTAIKISQYPFFSQGVTEIIFHLNQYKFMLFRTLF